MKNMIVLSGVLLLCSCADNTVRRRVKILSSRTIAIKSIDSLYTTGDTIYVDDDGLWVIQRAVVLSNHVCSDSSHVLCDGECDCDGMECNQ